MSLVVAVPDFDGLIVLRRGSRKGPCAGYPGEDREHDKHLMQPVWLRWHRPKRTPPPEVTRWSAIADGYVCSICKNAFEATATCERETDSGVRRCYNRARVREVGYLNSWSPIVTHHNEVEAEHNYCGSHAPSVFRKRKAVVKARDDARTAKWKVRTAKRDAVSRATSRLLAEAIRWRDDEVATEGFCGDETCEHHECRLDRAVVAYEAALAIPAWEETQ